MEYNQKEKTLKAQLVTHIWACKCFPWVKDIEQTGKYYTGPMGNCLNQCLALTVRQLNQVLQVNIT